MTAEQLKQRTRECLEAVGLFHKWTRLLAISRGERRRVAIASLVLKPKLLLCDEPTGALDSENSDQILRLFRDLNESSGVSILIVTHSDSTEFNVFARPPHAGWTDGGWGLR